MRDAYALVVDERPLDDSWKDLESPAFICPKCGRIYLFADPSGDEEPKPPDPACDVCGHQFDRDGADKPRNTPLQVKQCPSNEDRNFAITPVKGKWEYSLRDFRPDHCPCKECKSKKKWRRSEVGQ